MGAVSQFLVRNAPKILTGIAVGGTIVTAVLAAKETMVAQEVIDNYKEENPDATRSDIVKKAAPVYAPAILSCLATIGCIVGAAVLNGNHIALLEGVCSTGSIAATQYHKAVVDAIGEKKDQEIREQLALKKMHDTPVDDKNVFITGNGNQLFQDSWTGRYFRSCYESVMKAMYDTLDEIEGRSEVEMNDYFFHLKLPPAESGRGIGWNEEHPLKMHVYYSSDDNGEPCGIIVYDTTPGAYTYMGGWRTNR